MYVLVNLETLNIDYRYNIEYPPAINTETHIGVEIPPDVDVDCTMAIRVDDGTIIIKQDPEQYRIKLEHLKSSLRIQRNSLLVQCDWTQFTDSPLSQDKKAEWANYRQDLRNLPKTVTDPTNVTWPVPPA
jgi:hypothetical protein